MFKSKMANLAVIISQLLCSMIEFLTKIPNTIVHLTVLVFNWLPLYVSLIVISIFHCFTILLPKASLLSPV